MVSFFISYLVPLLVLALLLWPRSGYLWRWRRLVRLSGRVLLEDGLKHLYDCEYRRRTASVESLAGVLEVPRSRAAEVLIQLEAMRMASSTVEEGVALTAAGREEALRIIRIHRLWERHLAERTGVSRVRWHEEAERQEHHLSAQETETLSEEMGHPAYDPHGDPIPTANGEVPPQSSLPLTALNEWELGRIEHVEDEPVEVYQRLIDAGLHPGVLVQLTRLNEEEVRLVADGRHHSLPPVMAGNLFVYPVDEEMPGPYDSLDDLELDESAQVVRISPACRGLERRRLMDIGLVPGTAVSMEMRSPTGDPKAYQIRGATIALRRHQARHIQIERGLDERAIGVQPTVSVEEQV
ncbi:MAG: FeoA domain-containing protein [bacterium]|nr:FeoA domain-containing protein [bacterium]